MAGRAAGKVVVVTGASQGQGAVEARALHAEGATVIAADVRDPVEPIDGVEYRRLDVSSADDWAALAADLERVDGLVNNAGITHRAALWDVTPADLERVLSVNLSGALFGIQALAPKMTGGGSIVNVASLAALTGHFAWKFYTVPGDPAKPFENAAMKAASARYRRRLMARPRSCRSRGCTSR